MTAQETTMTVDAATGTVFEMVGGGWAFKTLAAAVELGLSALAGGRTATKEELEAELGLAERPADMLLAACTALGLLDAGFREVTRLPCGDGFGDGLFVARA